jgi:hypothetical protein
VCVCVYVRYRTYLNVVGMGSKLLGVLRRTLRWSFNSQKFKKTHFENLVFAFGLSAKLMPKALELLGTYLFKREMQKKRENRRGRETVTGVGTGNVLDPSNAGYPPLVSYILSLSFFSVCRQ